ncbi:dynein regulatory complex subunit 2-like [Sitophilus oryzae]|uniref:Dynein regulatory complex subunit 2 n=1 Tax=Sitophilus oryzae TaxID=7048 RepID=A0A6J2XKS2_SITOR|nr:dynein regulatory complex subunit 2-like [Sitophilus oryzae]
MPPKQNLTPEERKELKLAKKAEKKLKQIEKKKQLKRDQLERELQYGWVTLRKHDQNWRRMLMDIKVVEMRKDLEFAWHNFERVIDCKDFTISLLMDELDKANWQYFFNLKTHSEQIDNLIRMFEDMVHELDTDFNNQVDELHKEHQKNVEEMKLSTTEEENYLKTMIHILNAEMKEVKRTRRAEYFSKLEEEDSKQNQIVHRVRGILEQQHLQVWLETVTFLEEYKERIKERKKEHNSLKIQDDQLQDVIKKQLDSIRRAFNTIRSLKVKQAEQEKFLGRKLGDLQSEFDFFTLAFNTLKNKLAKDRKLDFQKLNCLTLNYHDVISYFEDLETEGKHLLHVGAVCRKLETLSEKILAFPVNFLTEMSKVSAENVEEYISSLDLFWQRVGQADTLRYAVNEEREFLITENEILKRRLHKYCQCLQCPDYQPFKTMQSEKSMYVTEGTLELKKYAKQLNVRESLEESVNEYCFDLHNWIKFDVNVKKEDDDKQINGKEIY